MAENYAPRAADVLAVKSRVSWGALAAGAMVALTIYIVLTLLGLALGVEVAVRGETAHLGTGAAVYSIVTLLLSMFFGGWAATRLAAGETKVEAVLYGLILWGVLFLGLIWLVSAGLRTGFGAMVGAASGLYTTVGGQVDVDRIARDMERAGVDRATIDKYRGYYERVRANPAEAVEVGREAGANPDVQRAAAEAARGTRQATWWALAGVLISVATVIAGALVGAGELLQPVPVLGVRGPRRPGEAATPAE